VREPNARERLKRAALALFAEHGYDAAAVADRPTAPVRRSVSMNLT
jgi:hypothetical protein